MTDFTVPKPNRVTRLLSKLFARTVTAAPGEPVSTDPAYPFVAGAYQDDSGQIAAVCLFDFPLAAYAGAALTMIPSPTAEESIRAGALSESIDENVTEVLNICVGFFSSESSPPIRLARICRGSELPAELAGILAADVPRLNLRLEIAGYGTGHLSLLAA